MKQQYTATVVMATYNGEKNILEQLDSLKNQSKKIDEVLIWDDCSTDSTVKIIENFISENKLGETWHLKINTENLGWRKNFFNLLNAATKEIVFTCDQDDIWDASKIEVMCEAFANTDVKVLVSDYTELVEPGGLAEELKKIDSVKLPNQKAEQIIFNENNLFLRRPGCVYAIRKSFIANVNLYASEMENPVHDMAMWGSSLLSDGLYIVREELIRWRKHGKSSFKKEIDLAKRQNHFEERLNTLRRRLQRTEAAKNYLNNQPHVEEFEYKDKVLSNLIKELNMRVSLLERKKIIPILCAFFKYHHKFYFSTDMYHIMKYKIRK